jgi:hypothetical protein
LPFFLFFSLKPLYLSVLGLPVVAFIVVDAQRIHDQIYAIGTMRPIMLQIVKALGQVVGYIVHLAYS